MKKENNLPKVWNKAKTNKFPEGTLWFNPDYAEKLKIFKNGEWVETDPFEDLEERRIKK